MRIPLLAGFLLTSALAAAIPPAHLVPMRWSFTDPAALSLLDNTRVNCLLVEWGPKFPAIAAAAAKKNVSVLAIVKPDATASDEARKALDADAQGIVLEGDYPVPVAAKLRDTLAPRKTLIVEITQRGRMNFASPGPILATYQGVWPGIQVQDNGKSKAAPSGAAWIDTNMGFLQAARAMSGGSQIWLGVRPPEKQVILPERYLQAVGDAAAAGSRWIISLDSDLTGAIEKKDPRALKAWKRIADLTGWFEQHPEWRDLPAGGKLAIVQDEQHGALLSGGILDMISTKHTPVRPVSPTRLSAQMLEGASMTVNVEPDALTPAQQEILLRWRKNGGTLLSAPPGWKEAFPTDITQISLDEKQLKQIDAMWHEVSNMIGRKNLGVRLFNVSSMLSTFRSSESGRPAVVQLVNYADYPIDSVTVHLLGKFTKAHLYLPDGKEKDLEVYEVEDGTGVDIDVISTCAALRVE